MSDPHTDVVRLDGLHAVKHALRFGAQLLDVVTADRDRLAALADELAPDVRDALLARVRVDPAVRLPPTGVVATARRPPFAVPPSDGRPAVLLDQPRHLGNVGAVIRVAAAAHAAMVVVTGAADPWHPQAVRGAAGLQFALAVGGIEDLDALDRPIVAVDPAGDPIGDAVLPPDAVLAFGAERQGLSATVLGRAHARVALPMRAGVSSLNLATAVAAALYALGATGRVPPPR